MYFQRRCHENEKKNRKKLKMQNFENEKKNMAWRYGENLALICLTGSEKLVLRIGGRTEDGRPRDDSSSAEQ